MTPSGIEQIKFEVETTRVLEILSREIYDSPFALLRENLQNAYDAVLMKAQADGQPIQSYKIDIRLNENELVISDDGIGMSEDVLRNNFWKAGSSGKRNELAYKSGVIGNFGIGAMANFGVATKLTVETRSHGSTETLVSVAERSKLSIARECIDLYRRSGAREPGTTLTVELEAGTPLNPKSAGQYLEQYVRFLPVPVLLNGTLISQQSIQDRFVERSKGSVPLPASWAEDETFRILLHPRVDTSGKVYISGKSIHLGGTEISGELSLAQDYGHLMGLRNYFGLAPIPVSGYYQFGGIANLAFLQPTAGREALSRESIAQVHRLIGLIETAISGILAEHELAADRNSGFQQYIVATQNFHLARNVTIEIAPKRENVALGKVKEYCGEATTHYYAGRDPAIIHTFSSAEACLLNVSQNSPRRQIQIQYIQQFLGIPLVPDRPTITRVYHPNELTMEEASLAVRIISTLSEDYLLPNSEVRFVTITHGVNLLVTGRDGIVHIDLARGSSTLVPILKCYQTSHEVFSGFVKDFVRVHLYQKFSHLVPSATKEGADALAKILQRNRELFRYEDSELGNLEPLLADYLAGNSTLGEVLRTAKHTARPQSITVRREQVGTVEQALPDVVDSPSSATPEQQTEGREFDAAPPILRQDVSCDMKILVAEGVYPQLNGFQLFLALSDRLFRLESEFFKAPHTTRVIWASHRVIYIFRHDSGRLTLYYDLELKEALKEDKAGGTLIPTTTLFTKNRIYVPIPTSLVEDFKINEGAKEFFVRFDTILE